MPIIYYYNWCKLLLWCNFLTNKICVYVAQAQLKKANRPQPDAISTTSTSSSSSSGSASSASLYGTLLTKDLLPNVIYWLYNFDYNRYFERRGSQWNRRKWCSCNSGRGNVTDGRDGKNFGPKTGNVQRKLCSKSSTTERSSKSLWNNAIIDYLNYKINHCIYYRMKKIQGQVALEKWRNLHRLLKRIKEKERDPTHVQE